MSKNSTGSFSSKNSCSKFIITTEPRNDVGVIRPIQLIPVTVNSYDAFFDADKIQLEKDFDDDVLILRSAKAQGSV